MNTLRDIITYVRRIIKSPSDSTISDNLIIDYINRFWLMDVDARIQLFDLKTTYQFQTTPGIINYNMPLYQVQVEPGSQNIASYPVYQGFLGPCYINGISVPFFTQKNTFTDVFPLYLQSLSSAGIGTGVSGTYTINLPFSPVIAGSIDITGIINYINDPNSYMDPIFGSSFNTSIPTTSVQSAVYFTATDANGQNIVVADSGQFLSNSGDGDLYGILMNPGKAPFGNAALSGGYSTSLNTINYNTGVANINFPSIIPEGNQIQAQCYFYNAGLPRGILFYNNTLTILPPPNTSCLVSLEAYLSPAAFLSTSSAIPFAYMAEYIARGAARKILSDTGDIEQFNFYEPLFIEQERLVWKRSQRQFTATRTNTIFSETGSQGSVNNLGQGAGI